MAVIDLKNATIYIKDGYSVAGVAAASVALGGVSITTTFGASVAVVTGDYFHINSGTKEYRITGHAENAGSTTIVTFTPALLAAVASNDTITVGPHRIEVKIGEGNLTYTEKKARQYLLNRGRLDTVRNADEEPVEVSLDFTWEFIKADSGETPSVEDVLKQSGEASTWTTSAADVCEPYAVDLEIFYDVPCSGVKDEKIVLSDFRYEELQHDLRQGQVSITGKCNVTAATVSRQATPTA